jgi:multidrug efflux pump
MMGGIVGRLFREFAVTLSAAILISMVISLTTTPMMCAYLLRKSDKAESHGRLYHGSERFFDAVLAAYRASLTWVLSRPALTLIILGLTIALNVVIVITIPKGFFPPQDTGAIAGGVQGAQDTSFAAMNSAIQAISGVIRADPAVDNVIVFTGGNGPTNAGFIYIALKPLAERRDSAFAIINRLRPKLNHLPGAAAFLQASQDLRIGGRSSNAMYQYTLQSDNITELMTWGPTLLREMRVLPGLLDVNTDQQNGGLGVRLDYDRQSAAKVGQTVQSLDAALYDAFGQSEVSVIYTQLNQYYVVLEADPLYWKGPEGLKDIFLQDATGHNIPLSVMSSAKTETLPLAVNHTGLFPSVTVSFNLATGVSLSEATSRINDMQRRLKTPTTIHGFFAGTAAAYQQSLAAEPLLVAAALIAVYIVLGILYESLIHPLTIISTLPSASVGAMLALMLFKEDLNVISIIGIVLLIGIVKKNAILMIDFALQAQRQQHLSSADAIFAACMLRFRPIMMTTMAAVFGAVPLAFDTGTGAELRRPLGITIVGGLLVSQMLTLYTTPVVYLAFDRLRQRMQGRSRAVISGQVAPAAVPL